MLCYYCYYASARPKHHKKSLVTLWMHKCGVQFTSYVHQKVLIELKLILILSLFFQFQYRNFTLSFLKFTFTYHWKSLHVHLFHLPPNPLIALTLNQAATTIVKIISNYGKMSNSSLDSTSSRSIKLAPSGNISSTTKVGFISLIFSDFIC